MRRLATLALAFLLALAAAPALAPADVPDSGNVDPEQYDPDLARLNPGECRTLAKQIVRYTDVAAMADDRGDDLWESHTRARVDRLEERWNALCADPDDSMARAMWAALRTAGQVALRYFTMGAY